MHIQDPYLKIDAPLNASPLIPTKQIPFGDFFVGIVIKHRPLPWHYFVMLDTLASHVIRHFVTAYKYPHLKGGVFQMRA